MSGHSKWASIKHKKAKVDAQRGKTFTKLIKEITVAARSGGGDVNANARLRSAIQVAKDANMPASNVERAIKKGTGELPGVNYEELAYEGYGPAGVAIYAELLTDNKNRTVSEIKHVFSKNGGHLAEAGSVAWMFEKKGLCHVKKNAASEDRLMEIVLDAGAEDMNTESDFYEIITNPQTFEQVKAAILKEGITPELAEITMVPKSTVPVAGKKAEQVLHLVETLEDHDDVQHVYANFDISDEEMGKI
ncbi:MAG: YebC/PmpR family DNA-binding transcriptional regulator [bacterium]|nr:YebC/PmpR family DNA-binding transcriptional regulator [bacterium]